MCSLVYGHFTDTRVVDNKCFLVECDYLRIHRPASSDHCLQFLIIAEGDKGERGARFRDVSKELQSEAQA